MRMDASPPQHLTTLQWHSHCAGCALSHSLRSLLPTASLNHCPSRPPRSSQFLHREIPIRLARRVRTLSEYPWPAESHKHVRAVQQNVLKSITNLVEFPLPRDVETVREFQRLHVSVRSSHTNTHRHMANALTGLSTVPEPPGLTKVLNSFYASRIGIRLLVDQHMALDQARTGFVGIVEEECDVQQVIDGAVKAALDLYRGGGGGGGGVDVPEVIVNGGNIHFRYMPAHIQLMVFELLKNALTASIKWGEDNGQPSPPIEIVASGGKEDVTIRISDKGGGFKRADRVKLFSYAFSTAQDEATQYDPVAAAVGNRESTPLAQTRGVGNFKMPLPAGWHMTAQGPRMAAADLKLARCGFGLPVGRLHATHFGGDLRCESTEGIGTDAFVYLPRLQDEQEALA